MKNVLLVQALAKQYRVRFFDGLYSALKSEGVRLQVAYGSPPPGEQSKADDVTLDPVYGLHVPGRWLLGGRLLYQPVLAPARGADLVIVEHANKQLVNLPLLLRARVGRGKLAFWGQGKNVLRDSSSVLERLKARTIRLADWWFAYTAGVAAYLRSRGVRPETVTTVQNAIDTRRFRGELAAVSEAEVAETRARLGMARHDPVGLFCGSLYAPKKLEFLIEAARRIRAEVPTFQLVIVGAGPAEPKLAACAAGARWIHFVGRQSGAARAVYFRMAAAFLIPAFVGLAVLDAFAAELPVVTTELPHGHGVEIEYIEHGRNGLITGHESAAYAVAVAGLLRDGDLREQLSAGARQAGGSYTIEAMIENFAGGVVRCLGGGKG